MQTSNKTIFITISRGSIARNLLQNEFYDLVKNQFKKVVIITTASQDKRFNKEFIAPNVQIIHMPDEQDTYWSAFVSRLYMYLIFNKSTIGHGLYRYVKVPTRNAWLIKFFRFTLMRVVFQPLSKISFLRKTLQWFDYRFLQSKSVEQYKELIEEYRPNIVFVGNMLEESALMKASRKKGVPTIAMPKTWDNPSKRYFRAKADNVVVWGSFMKDQMMQLHDYHSSDITIVGVPQFDYYLDKSYIESHTDFCQRLGLDPKKKIICFTSEGSVMPSDADIAEILSKLIQKQEFDEDCQLLIRPHFAYKDDDQKFIPLNGSPDVVIDTNSNQAKGFNDHSDYSKSQMHHFLNILFHSDVIISTCSTISLDSAAMSRPSILIMFDGYEKKPFYDSCRRWYLCDNFEELLRFKPALIATDVESLRESVNKLLRNPKLLEINQRRLCERFCYHMDGKSGIRLFQKITDLSKTKIIK